MPTVIYTPRVNNNDDTVRLSAVLADVGSRVRAGDPLIDVETDKATFTVESTTDGYLLGVAGALGDTLQVGSVLAWIGATPDESIEVKDDALAAGEGVTSEPTLKALLLLKAHGLRISDVPHNGRLTAADVERHAALRPAQRAGSAISTSWLRPEASGRTEPLTPEQKAMARTVCWHRDEAAAGYIELPYDPKPWDSYAAEFQKAHSLLLSPLLALMAWRLAKLAANKPAINATVTGEGAYLYDRVNLSFTVQAGTSLYLVVVRDAGGKSAEEFVGELGELQRAAMKHALKPEQTADPTIGFTSMARWKVSRHIPILAPYTSLMVAHSYAPGGLGASYDHRLLTGFDVAQVLKELSAPA